MVLVLNSGGGGQKRGGLGVFLAGFLLSAKLC